MALKIKQTDLFFKNRIDAGQKLAVELDEYRNKDVVVFGLTRGGVPVAKEVADKLGCPLEPLIIRKIGHPTNPEYAIGAISSGGEIVVNKLEVDSLDEDWFKEECEKQKNEALRRVDIFLKNKKPIALDGKIAVIIDDGVATGYTMYAAIKEIKKQHPKKIIVAVPVAPPDVIEGITAQVDECVALCVPEQFLGAVGAYYGDFSQTTDDDVLNILQRYETRKD